MMLMMLSWTIYCPIKKTVIDDIIDILAWTVAQYVGQSGFAYCPRTPGLVVCVPVPA